jgi:tRNA threonylcarbamoyladenosine biosynthesis protein TsaE
VIAQAVCARITTRSPRGTEGLGRWLGARLRPGDVVALVGPLGSGKTVLARAMALGAGAQGYFASPSFVVIREYGGPLRIYHVDLYRIERADDMAELGLDELADAGGVLIVEWADRAGDLLPADHIRVECDYGRTERERTFTLRAPASLADRLEGIAGP